MATRKARASKGRTPSSSDVPVAQSEATERAARAAARVSASRLNYGGGPLLSAVEVFTVFWGAGWQEPAHAALIPKVNQFLKDLLNSPFMAALAEYSTLDYPIGPGRLAGSATIADALAATVDDKEIRTMLQSHIAAGHDFPQVTANFLFIVYLPAGVTVTSAGQKSCQAFCAYHDAIDEHVFYIVTPYPDCAGCAFGEGIFDSLTFLNSHNLSEAITDAVPGKGWYASTHGEVGDICVGESKKKVGPYVVTKVWSNNARDCV